MTSGKIPGPKAPKGRRDMLSDEDHALWQHTASTLDRSQRLKPRVHAAIEDHEPAHLRRRLNGETRIVPQGREAAPSPATAAPREETPANRSGRGVPALSEIDRKAARRLRSGRAEIEARLDLHGMRQGEAHAALRSFLFSCHAQGRRWVLVITGKGGLAGATRHEEANGWPWDVSTGRDRGVLRRCVPMWLAQPDLRNLVVSFSEASIRHGGEGALYIQVRSPGRALPTL